MKPLPPAPLTFEDWAISMDHRNDPRRAYLLGTRFGINREQDRRDAELMYDLVDRYCGRVYLRVGRENVEVPAVHVLVRKNPLWPEQQCA